MTHGRRRYANTSQINNINQPPQNNPLNTPYPSYNDNTTNPNIQPNPYAPNTNQPSPYPHHSSDQYNYNQNQTISYQTPMFNAPIEIFQSSLNVVPESGDLLKKTGLPLGAVIRPLAPIYSTEGVPVLDCSSSVVIRCQKCRTYLNPYVKMLENGRRWECNICNLVNQISPEIYSSFQSQGMPSRPELSYGVIDIIPTSEYMVRPPQPPAYFFLIDVSYYSVNSGILHIATDTIKQLIDKLPGGERTRFGIATFDSKVHFYDLTKNRPHIQIYGDVNEVFVPPGHNYYFQCSDYMDNVIALLDALPTMYAKTNEVQSCLGTALSSAHNIMRQIGGKLIVITSLLPLATSKVSTLGEGRLKDRLSPKILGSDKEYTLFQPQTDWYKKFALECSKSQISIDCYLFDHQKYMDVATISQLSHLTCGQVFYYPHFSGATQGLQFCRDLERNLMRETGFEGVLRLRTMSCIKATEFLGNVFLRSNDLIALPSIDSDKSFSILFQINENISRFSHIYFQAALLYTTSEGERRIRVINYALPVTKYLVEVFNNVNCHAIINLLGKSSIIKASNMKLEDIRNGLINKCVEILAAYKQLGGVNLQSPTQIVLPQTLQSFPLYILALIKSILFRSGQIHPDVRVSQMNIFRILDSTQSVQYLYPQLYKIYPLEEGQGLYYEDQLYMPEALNLSSEKLESNSVYLLDNGLNIIIWFRKNVRSDVLMSLLGTTDFTTPGLSILEGSDEPNSLVARVNNIINALRSFVFKNILIFQEGNPSDHLWFSYMIEDRYQNVYSYYEFLSFLQQQVQSKTSK